MYNFEYFLENAKKNILNNNLNEAKKNLQKAYLIKDDSPIINNLLGVLEEIQNNILQAQKYYRIALIFDASYNPAKKNIERTLNFEYSKLGIDLG